ncbi:Hypothetical protein CINCED_3A016241 [Cinara cedri]|uniref:Uncharacterized protein n=1 Tax=Cinara cedri TaxID=506608 RepID=A0A5E4MAG2_9HEMI|nr:Hypothetical protein CINCED_3A016241 [Cinara cedri]
MIKFNIIIFFSVCFFLSIVFQCKSLSLYNRRRCPSIRVNNGRVRLRSNGRLFRIICNYPFRLVHGREIMTCIDGEWDNELPICARTGCSIVDSIANGRLNVLNQGAKLEVTCNPGYTINGPSFVYCNEDIEWNEELKGCKELDQIILSCDFESANERFCGWTNDDLNNVNWMADNVEFALFFISNRYHVQSGSSDYFSGNYISLDAGNYGSSTFGRLVSPSIPPPITQNKQRCLIFGYKVMSGKVSGVPKLTVTFGGIPHWETFEGEGKAMIGLFTLNDTARIIIEGKSCKAAIDNIVIAEGNGCIEQPNEGEFETCYNSCGSRRGGTSCSCDWECYNNNNCCPDINLKCPYIKPKEEIVTLYLTFITTTPIPIKLTTAVHSNISYTTNSHITVSSKTINDSKVSNNFVTITTPMNKYNILIPSMTSTKIPKIISTLNLNSTLSVHGSPNTTTKSLTLNDSITTANKTFRFLNTTTIGSTMKSLIMNNTTISTSINTSNSKIKPLIIYFNTSTSLIDTPNATTKLVIENTTSTTKLINYSSTIINVLKSNDSSIVKQTTFITESPNIQIIKQTTLIDKTEPTTNSSTSSPKNTDHLNTVTVPNRKFVVIDIDNHEPDLISSKYNTTLIKSSLSNNSLPNVTTNRSVIQLYTFWENVNLTTTQSYEKLELNYSLYHEHNKKFNKWLADQVKKNADAKSVNSFNTVTIIKYIAAIGVIIITFKFTLSFIKWYFKKPSEDSMNMCFVETDEVDICSIELTSPGQVETNYT